MRETTNCSHCNARVRVLERRSEREVRLVCTNLHCNASPYWIMLSSGSVAPPKPRPELRPAA